MSTTALGTNDLIDGMADSPLILEDLLCQLEVLLAANSDPATISDLWAQVDLLQAQ